MKLNLVYLVIILLLLIVGYQAYKINVLHKEYSQMQLNEAIKTYSSNQVKLDSLIQLKLDSLKNAKVQIEKYYYKTKEIVKADAKELQTKSDSVIAVELEYWINKRKRASDVIERKSD